MPQLFISVALAFGLSTAGAVLLPMSAAVAQQTPSEPPPQSPAPRPPQCERQPPVVS